MKLSNEEIAKVFAMYIGCAFVFSESNKSLTSTGVTPNLVYDLHQDKYVLGACKLLLTPLSGITDEHAVEVAKMIGFDKSTTWEERVHIGNGVIAWHIIGVTPYDDGPFDTARNRDLIVRVDAITIIEIYQYLISCGYAMPLFFAPNHWANGKTPLDLGIAISKNEVK